MNRFFVDLKEDNHFVLSKEHLKHLKVLRIDNKPFICVYQEQFYKCILNNEVAEIIEIIDQNHESDFEIILAISVIKFERFEWLLQKATELGVSRIIPFVSDHTNHELVKYNKYQKKIQRFETIILNAAEQSFRNKLPILEPLTTFTKLLDYPINNKIIAHEKVEVSKTLIQPIDQEVIFFVGPEGGFSDNEIDLAIKHNFNLVSLGSRILRAETAGIFLLSQIKIK
ncbi:16S rRNA (uracil(1498)-N(3))-methyltransferase [Mycoplasma sp. NEAQ87857]|uniref:16S rRNA (uracil(1498)-N(3))-methyltransferase n=1 Tax=Mycoplasma sp. NEAQ87857 TaxID=2683967 RepID=UPI0013198DD3|nr:16S rRNA (uracil(1498)-N(3))-methyltransferase [Mycoplasma sp. NEAQ87857]QGZ97576.1 16S rRNA (uracil(1498)-N(3))-methyltransferase [Mycoplasma sp. NEAQ87857]